MLISVDYSFKTFPCLLSQLPTPSTLVAHQGVVVPSAVRSRVQLLYSFPSMKNGNWQRRPSVVVQFVHGVGGVVVGVELGDPVPEEAEQGWSKSPEAMFWNPAEPSLPPNMVAPVLGSTTLPLATCSS